ncbi:MAG: hypothetical protein JO117_03635 [Verrucomicrobia bacterium]|nr:hypothetical protein [Verrucomicrobiota bacterium]MBV9658364.1 hypothetical protein [Verrucomicrobiota bacterium]
MRPTFPITETCSEAGLCWRFDLPAESPFFNGHFPGHPLLPGVVALGWLLAAAERFHGGEPALPLVLHNVKFQVVLLPGQPGLELSIIPQGPTRRLLARLISPAGMHASAWLEPAAPVG